MNTCYCSKISMLLLAFILPLIVSYGQERASESSEVSNLLGDAIDTDQLETFLKEGMKQANIPGLAIAIINDGKLVYHAEQGYANKEKEQAVTDKTIFEGASLSKPVFAFLIMSLVEDGKLDLDKPLYQYLPYPDIAHDDRYKKITARMVLHHSTGFPNWRSDSPDNKLRIDFEPGTNFQYSGEGFQYLALVAAHLLETDHKGLEQYFLSRVAKPSGMQASCFLPDGSTLKNKATPYRNGEALNFQHHQPEFGAAYGIHTNAVDFAPWIIAIMENKGLKKESFAEMLSPQFTMPEDHEQRQIGVTDWTLGFAKAEIAGQTVYGHGGNNTGYTCMFIMDIEKKWGFIMFTNADQVSQLGFATFMHMNGLN